MKKILLLCLLACFLLSDSGSIRADTDSIGVLVDESDGAPDGYVYKIRFPDGTLTLSGGIGTYTASGGSGTWVGLTDTPGSITAGQYVKGNAGGTDLEFGSPAGAGTMTSVKENDVAVGDSDIATLDFLGADFDLTESPDTEIQVVVAAAITRDAEWDTFGELQAGVADKTLCNEEDVCTLDADWVNTTNPWVDNEVADNITIDLATLATTVTITDHENSAETNAVVFLPGGDLDGGNLALESDGTFNYNPSTGTVTSTAFAGGLTGAVTGNADTATALAGNPTDCAANQFAQSIVASGNLTCAAIADVDVPDGITIALAATATALAANGANAGAGNAILGVDASGAAEGSFDVWTEAENTAAGYTANAGDVEDVFDCTTGDCATMTVGTGEYLVYGTGYIDANRFAGVTTVDATEFGYLNGVTSAIQTQFAGKEGTLTNSAGLAAAISDETGTGVAVLATSPTLVTPALGAATATSMTVSGAITGLGLWGSNITGNISLNTTDLHGKMYQVTAACTVTLDKVTDVGFGASIYLWVRDAAETVIVEIDAADKINLHGTPLDAGDTIDSPGNAGDFIILISTTDADGSGTDGWITAGYAEAVWTDGGAT